jgi:hypothetical protein
MVGGFLAQPGQRTVTGMLAGARLAGGAITTWPTGSLRPPAGRPDRLGLVLLDPIAQVLVEPDAALLLAVDDTLWRRVGRKIPRHRLAPRRQRPRTPPARLGPPLGRGRRHRPPTIPHPGSV